ncbi:hypothetical protein SAMN04488589_1745 [Methanolobus vulcani]|uniref:Uncharacterized protein n=1 Tax=Methanolobus vulcani TaxID=38026 RepID=A0A7Z7AX14_9EURY|nr:hypothetical protein [Methanolobus vulcani]SDF93731.1 hypothetical protein SAMN04488589_1745 [Methanolobus vulcani]
MSSNKNNEVEMIFDIQKDLAEKLENSRFGKDYTLGKLIETHVEYKNESNEVLYSICTGLGLELEEINKKLPSVQGNEKEKLYDRLEELDIKCNIIIKVIRDRQQ